MRIIPNGPLMEMAEKNRLRLQAEFYQAEQIYLDKNDQWSGDWQGRDLLAQLSHKFIFGEEPPVLPDLLTQLPQHLNTHGYFGKPIDWECINEQQLAGNSWFLRALCLWYEMGEKRALGYIRRVVNNLYLPLMDAIVDYPTVYQASQEGRFDGNLRSDSGKFQLSTDVGCFYIAIDGLAHAYRIEPNPDLANLIRKMIGRFMQTDIVRNRFQTHATLAALRGILEFATATEDTALLAFVEEMFEKYQKFGMTLNFANYNWFHRPEWTEPCAVVDSFLLARRLFRITGKVAYLKLSYQIFYNALVFALRENGGFGCDKCATEAMPEFRIDPGAYDAYWCCTMRGAEGIRDSLQLYKTGDVYQIDFITPGVYDFENGAAVEIQTNFPYENDIRITNRGSNPGDRFRVMLPMKSEILCSDGCSVEPLEQGYLISQSADSFSITIRVEQALTKVPCDDGFVYEYGVLRLCEYDAPSELFWELDGRKLKPVPQMWKMCKEDAMAIKVKIFFK